MRYTVDEIEQEDGFEYNKQAVKNMSEERDRLFVSESKLKESLQEMTDAYCDLIRKYQGITNPELFLLVIKARTLLKNYRK